MDASAPEKPEKPQKPYEPEPAPIRTSHKVEINGKKLEYTVDTGRLELKNSAGETEARIFFMAYRKKGVDDPSTRPLMFSFNGGPGSSSVWLHLGALGPKRVQMLPDGAMPAPPYKLVDNPMTWLEDVDLVFIDPVGTGYSRAEKPELGEKFWSVKGDIESIGEFIRLYLTKYERWCSPLYLVGESYGTTRAAGLSGHLVEKGIAFNGVLLVSSILNFQTAHFTKGNDLPYPLFLPTYTATAHFHGKLQGHLGEDLQNTLREVEDWAMTDYTLALAKGDGLAEDQREIVVDRLASYTGLSRAFIENSDLRIDIHAFCKELMRSERRTVGRLDSRFTGTDGSGTAEYPEFDPSMAAIRPPYTAMFNDYVRRQLGYENDIEYYILGGGIDKPWDWGSAGEGHPDTSDALRAAFSKNPHMRLFVASGFYDMATPYFATEYTLDHFGLDKNFKASVRSHYYPAGHMMYIDEGCMAQLKKDVSAFISG